MDKNILEMTRKEIKDLKPFKTNQYFNGIVIIPNSKHNIPEFECMSFILCNEFEIVGKLDTISDMMLINGANGIGNWRNITKINKYKAMTEPIDWKIDCLSKSHLLRIYCSKHFQ